MNNQQIVDNLVIVARNLRSEHNEVQKEDKELSNMYLADSGDYFYIADLINEGKVQEAIEIYDKLDTASREYLWDYLPMDVAQLVSEFFGY